MKRGSLLGKPGALVVFALGAVAVVWVAAGSGNAHPLALAMTLVIGLVYAGGGLELWRFQRDTQAMQTALDTANDEITDLPAWLASLPATLRDAARRRLAGERVGLPGPALTGYLVGLLLLLGMLGTFLGLVVTLDGTVLALERTTDLAAMRAALAAPVKGLGLAFGTSVAGVAASASLGLMAALARRERAGIVRSLDRLVATALHGFTRDAQRGQQLAAVADALQSQASLLPGVVAQVQALMTRLDAQHSAQQTQLLDGQAAFHRETQAQLGALAASVDQSLRDSLSEAARSAGATLQPVAEATMAGIARESAAVQARLAATAEAQLSGLSARTEATLLALGDGLRQHASALTSDAAQAHATMQAQAQESEAKRQAAWTQALHDLAATLRQQTLETQAHWHAQQAQLADRLAQGTDALQQQVAAQARNTISEVARLTDTAAQAPRAAAEVIAQLRGQLSDSLQRDQALLAERARLAEALTALINEGQRATTAQQVAVQQLLETSETLLLRTGDQLGQQLQAAAAQQADVATRLNGSAVEVASLGDSFAAAVQQFSATSGGLVAQLARMEAALDQSALRHDEQLAYYVAQAREVIDLSLSAQQPLMEALQRLVVVAPNSHSVQAA